jgi:hypothetical protein
MKFAAGREKLILTWLILASGLTVVLTETGAGFSLPREISLTVRTVFWLSILAYFWLRLFVKLNRKP